VSELWKVEIVQRSDGAVVHTLAPEGKPERVCERIEGGALINLDHERYSTRIVRVVDAAAPASEHRGPTPTTGKDADSMTTEKKPAPAKKPTKPKKAKHAKAKMVPPPKPKPPEKPAAKAKKAPAPKPAKKSAKEREQEGTVLPFIDSKLPREQQEAEAAKRIARAAALVERIAGQLAMARREWGELVSKRRTSLKAAIESSGGKKGSEATSALTAILKSQQQLEEAEAGRKLALADQLEAMKRARKTLSASFEQARQLDLFESTGRTMEQAKEDAERAEQLADVAARGEDLEEASPRVEREEPDMPSAADGDEF
jgi:hypothetical protein